MATVATATTARANTTPTAGQTVLNTAQITFQDGASARNLGSNTVTTRVDEILDVSITATPPTVLSVAPASASQPLAFVVTNLGNGTEPFTLSAAPASSGNGFAPNIRSIVIDTSGTGQLNLANDTIYQGGATRPTLAPGQSVTVWVLSDIPSNATGTAAVQLTVSSAVGHGAPGLVFAGAGAGGVDAVVGATGATATASASYSVATAPAKSAGSAPPGLNAALVKTQTVKDRIGGTRAVSGSTITYGLNATFSAGGTFAGAQIADAIPMGTTFVAGSVRLDGGALPDAAVLTGGGVAVPLGDVAGPAQHTVTFQVRIN